MAKVAAAIRELSNSNPEVVDIIPGSTTIKEYIQQKIDDKNTTEDFDEPFRVVNLGEVIGVYEQWIALFPNVRPFYAVKANDDKLLLKTVAIMGTGFDCASKSEMKAVLDHGVSPDRIVYANPFKQISHLQFASKMGVECMTFDTEGELRKIKKHYPSAKLLVRLGLKDSVADATKQYGEKFGCSVPMAKHLLDTAASLDVQVVGVCFHIGTGIQIPSEYTSALGLCSEVFQYASSRGHHMTILDIGGGYPSVRNKQFPEIARCIQEVLDKEFGKEKYPLLDIRAEPGTGFCQSSTAVVLSISTKNVTVDKGKTKAFEYCLTDSAYGSFSTILLTHMPVYCVDYTPILLKDHPPSSPLYPTMLWGRTLDPMDKLSLATPEMPEMEVGDWMYFEDMGAYNKTMLSTFNGFPQLQDYYFIQTD